MLFTQIANRTARGVAVGALILSLSATTFGGLANAARLADDTQDCSAAAHARNDAVHVLHEAWKFFDGDLKDLARDVRKLQHEAHKSGTTLPTDAREAVADARHDLKDIVSQAHEDIQDATDLGTACKEENEDATPTTTTTTTTTTSAAAPTDSSSGAGGVDTNGLEQKYKDIVDKAIADMQLVVDGVNAAVLDVTAATESTETSDDAKVKTELKTAKAEREKAKEHRDEARTEAKGKSKGKSDVNRSSNSGKGRDGEDQGRK